MTTSELQMRLSEAREALHAVTIGKQVASVEVDGQKIQFSLDSNITELRAYISRLETQIAGAQSKRALRVVF